MQSSRILGVVLLVIGVVLLGFGYHASNAPLDRLSNTVTGRFTDRTMWYFVLGAAAAIGGLLLAMFRQARSERYRPLSTGRAVRDRQRLLDRFASGIVGQLLGVLDCHDLVDHAAIHRAELITRLQPQLRL